MRSTAGQSEGCIARIATTSPVVCRRGGALGDVRLLRDARRLARRDAHGARTALRPGARGRAARRLPRARAGNPELVPRLLLPRGADDRARTTRRGPRALDSGRRVERARAVASPLARVL